MSYSHQLQSHILSTVRPPPRPAPGLPFMPGMFMPPPPGQMLMGNPPGTMRTCIPTRHVCVLTQVLALEDRPLLLGCRGWACHRPPRCRRSSYRNLVATRHPRPPPISPRNSSSSLQWVCRPRPLSQASLPNPLVPRHLAWLRPRLP